MPLISNRRFWLPVWALIATANLSAGVVIASLPQRRTDLETFREWAEAWLVNGSNIYSAFRSADYPPHAIVALSPLGMVSLEAAVPVWAALNLALAITVTFLAIRTVRPETPASEAALPMLMFLCWGGFRTLLQFSLLTLAFGLAAMLLARKRPAWSGICLGLALMKPQIALPFFLWMVFTRRWRILGISLIAVIGGLAAFCIRAMASPWIVASQYLRLVMGLYGGSDAMVGLSNLRPLIARVASDAAVTDAVAASISLMMLAAICRWGWQEAKHRTTLMYSAPALVGVWSLLTFYHLTYSFVLLVPAAALLFFDDDLQTAMLRRRLFWLMQIGLMIDVPTMWRRFGFFVLPIISDLLLQVDRVLMLAIFVGLTILAAKARRAVDSPVLTTLASSRIPAIDNSRSFMVDNR